MNWRGLAALVATVLLTFRALLLAPLSVLGPFQWATAALAILLEWRAVPLLSGSFFSAAPALYLALILLGGSAVRLALLAAGLGLLCRWLTRSRAQLRDFPLLLADFLPLAATAVAQAFSPHPFVLLDVYLLLGYVAPAWLTVQKGPGWYPLRSRVRMLWLSACLLGPVWAGLNLWTALALTPALWCLQFAADRAVDGYRALERDNLRQQLERTWSEIEQQKGQRAELQMQLNAQVAEASWRQEVERQLAACENRASFFDRLGRLLGSLLAWRSLAILERQSDSWECKECRSPDAEQLEAASLLQVDLAPGFVSAGATPLVRQEGQGLIYALAATVVLYVGANPWPEWTIKQRELLQLVGECAARRWQLLQKLEQLRLQAGLGQELNQRVGELQELLLVASGLAARLDPDQVLDQLFGALSSFPGESRWVGLTTGQQRANRPELHFTPVVEQVLQSRLPLLLDEVSQSRFPGLTPGDRSLLAAPMQEWGAIALGSSQPGAFTRDHQDRLGLLGYLAAQALTNSYLHSQVVEALARQKESQSQLVQSSKMAAVGQLAAGVAHELNTPLASVVLGLEAGSRGNPSPLLKTALEAALQAKTIVSKLLFYSRDARHGQVETDLNQIVEDTLQLIGQQLRLDKVKVELRLKELPRVQVNQNEIQQVVTNLILNAKDALLELPAEGRTITVSSEHRGEQVSLAVCDSGPGVAIEVRSRIFEPFFTTKAVGKGTGLGLSVSQQIVAAHKGELLLEESPSGACFRVLLPVQG